MRPVVLISPAGTEGWRQNEASLAAALGRLAAPHEVRRIELGRFERLRHPWVTGAPIVAAAARRALRGSDPSAVIAVNSTAAMLLPFRSLRRRGIPVAVRIDCPAGAQFPGPLYAPQRALERRALRRADLVLTMGPASTRAVRPLAPDLAEVPIGVELSPPRPAASPPYLLAYGGQPEFKGLDLLCEAWSALGERGGDARLLISGIEPEAARRFLAKQGIAEPQAIEWVGRLPRAEYLDRLAGATAFVSASRLEGHGIAQLEALAAGVPLVTTPASGAYEAWPLAHELAPELVSEREPGALAGAIAAAIELSAEQRAGYAQRAAGFLAPYTAERLDSAMVAVLRALGLAAPAPTGVQSGRQSAD